MEPILNLWLYEKIRRDSNGVYANHREVMQVFRKNIPWTPRSIYYEIIKEMEKDGLLKRVNKRFYKDLLQDYNFVLESLKKRLEDGEQIKDMEKEILTSLKKLEKINYSLTNKKFKKINKLLPF